MNKTRFDKFHNRCPCNDRILFCCFRCYFILDYNSSTYLLSFQKSKHVFGSGMQTEKACSMSPTTLLDLKESLEGLLKGAR